MRQRALRLQVHYFLLFAPVATATTYLNLHFRRTGLSDSEIGTLGAVGAVVAVVSPPFWGYLADRAPDKRTLLAFLLLASGAAYSPFLLVRTYQGALLLQALFSFFMTPCVALTDALVLEQLPRAGGDYGRIRLWGSLGFVSTLLVFGLFLGGGPLSRHVSGGSLAPTFAAFAVARVLSVLWLLRVPSGKAPTRRSGYRGDLRELLGDPGFALLLFSAFLCTAGLRAYYVFFSIYLDDLGVADSLKGVFWSLGVLSEVLFMVFAARVLRRMGVRGMLALGMTGGAVRLLLFSLPLPLPILALAQGLHALAFGATHIATVTFISARVPDRLRASGQTLYAGIVGGIGGAAGSRLAGDLAEARGIPDAFRAGALLALAAALVAARLPQGKPGAGGRGEA
ncbi:MAG: MFS transporter [Armatimonadetes bacterium]|nr:MFS transporter [Armatimonadota bacterium]